MKWYWIVGMIVIVVVALVAVYIQGYMVGSLTTAVCSTPLPPNPENPPQTAP